MACALTVRALGLATLERVGQHLAPRLCRPAERSDQEEVVEQQIIRALLEDQYHAARLVPAIGPIPQFMEPAPRFGRATQPADAS